VPVRFGPGSGLCRGADYRPVHIGIHRGDADPDVGTGLAAQGAAAGPQYLTGMTMRLLKLVFDDTNVKFKRWVKPFFVFGVLVIVASIALVLVSGLNLGVDFGGGQQISVTFTPSEAAPVDE